MQSKETQRPSLILLVATLFTLIVAFHLGNALAGKSFYRAAHLSTALEYAHGPINLARPIIVGFNATATPAAQELPLWQAAAGLVLKAAGSDWYGWANVVSLFFFATGLWPFFQLARQYVGERAAWWGLAFFLAQPLIIVMAGEASTDGFSLVTTIWFLFFADKMIRNNQVVWWLPTALFACLGALSKIPFFMAAGICGIGILLANNVRSWRPWLLLAGAGAAAAVVFVGWTHYTDFLAAQAEYPFVELRLSKNPFLEFWFFGDLHTRLNPGGWIKGGWRFLHATLGSLPFVGLLLPALIRPGNRLPKLWLLATFLTILVFTQVVLIHWHYYLMCCPAVALLCGSTLARWEDFWAQQMPQSWLRFGLAGLILILSGIDGLISMKIGLYYDNFPKQVAAIIQQQTKPDDKLIVFGVIPLWGGEELFRSGRKGFQVYTLENAQGGSASKGLRDMLNSEADLRRLKSLGYTKLVLISQSPVRFAIQAVNPGSHIERLFYPERISPKVDAWPVVYRSEDVLIKEIP